MLKEVAFREFKKFIDKDPDREVIYRRRLEDGGFVRLFAKADQEISSDCYSYLTDNCLGISFATSFVLGNHFQIEIEYESIKDMLIIDLY